jgi:putative ABC transport system permease protein
MIGYYFGLALHSLKRNRVLTALMILAVGLGIGASMTTLTVLHVLSGDPLPGKSDRVFRVQLDAEAMQGYKPGGEPPEHLTRLDAETLLAQRKAQRQAMMSGGAARVDAGITGRAPQQTDVRFTTADFFPMFQVPLRHGRTWTPEEDQAHGRLAVISDELNSALFAGEDSTGRSIRVNGQDLRIIGVLGPWRPIPKFYDLNTGRFRAVEGVFLPFTTARDLKISFQGSSTCWGEGGTDMYDVNAPCAWLQYWVELAAPADRADYLRYLDNYSAQQREMGRYARPVNVRLRSVTDYLLYKQVIPSDVRLQVWLAFGFLAVCLVNTIALLLATFLRRAPEISLRRALGASRLDIFRQCLVEAGTVGIAGGVAGLCLASVGLWAIRQQPASYAALAHLDLKMLLMTLGLALVSSVLAGLLPAWQAMKFEPASQLKSE